MSVPKGTVDEHGKLRRAECDVGSARQVSPMTPPTANADRPESAAQSEFGLGITVLDPAHYPAAFCLAEHIGHD
jgi:hypothetical protein